MQHKVIFVGAQFRLNQPLFNYVLREVKQTLQTIDEMLFFDENDKEIFLALEAILQNPSKLLIVTSKNSFSSVGKMLCTLTSDTQIVKDDMLIPSLTEVFAPNSYLLKVNDTLINTLQVEASLPIPAILLDKVSETTIIQIFEQTEEDIRVLLLPLIESFDVSFKTSTLISGWVLVEISATVYGDIDGFISSAQLLMPQKIIQTCNMMAYIIQKLNQSGKKLTCAESCTGGLISKMITSQSGSSAVFEGSLVTYSNEIKSSWLGVEETTLIAYGAVSHETVRSMSKGAKEVAVADYAIAISGVAGPTGGTEEKPVGTVYLSVCTKKIHKSWHLKLQGDRNFIQEQSAYYAFKELLLSDKQLFFNLS